jgi:hypothetical protein
VCPPLVLMTARHLRRIDPIRRMKNACGMLNSTKVISGPIFITFSPLKLKFNIVSYSNFEIILQFLNNSKLNSKFKIPCSYPLLCGFPTCWHPFHHKGSVTCSPRIALMFIDDCQCKVKFRTYFLWIFAFFHLLALKFWQLLKEET